MKMLVTGGSGFTGRHVIPELVRRGHEVVALARSAKAAEAVEALGATSIPGDLDDVESVDAAFAAAGADVLVNIASLGFGHADTILAAALEAGITRGVFVSTTGIFTRLNPDSKAVRIAAEKAITTSGMATVIIRPTMIYGAPGDRNMERLIRLVKRAGAVPLPGGGSRLQQPVHVADLAAAIATAAERVGSIDGAYDVAGPQALSFREVVADVGRAVGRQVRQIGIPLAVVRGAVAVHERMPGRTMVKLEQIDRLSEDKAFDISPAIRDLDYSPRSFAEGIREEALACRS